MCPDSVIKSIEKVLSPVTSGPTVTLYRPPGRPSSQPSITSPNVPPPGSGADSETNLYLSWLMPRAARA